MKKTRLIALLLTTLLAMSLGAQSREKSKEIDYLGVAAVLIGDGNYVRAREALDEIDPADEDLDRSRYYTLKGLVELRQGEYENALESFNRARVEGQTDNVIYAYIGQAYFALERYEESIDAMDKLSSLAKFPDLFGLKSQAYWYRGDTRMAMDVLEEGIALYPEKASFLQQKVFYFIELDLNQAAMATSQKLLEFKGEDSEVYMALAESFRSGGEPEEAALLMEEAKLLFPDNLRVSLMLAQCYSDQQRWLTSAKLVEKVSYYDAKYLIYAAELYLQAGAIDRAYYLNSQISDPGEKTAMRFRLLIGEEKYEEALTYIPRLEREGLMKDEGLLYASAFVCFQTQLYDDSIALLNRISGSAYFRQATQLRQAIEILKTESILLF